MSNVISTLADRTNAARAAAGAEARKAVTKMSFGNGGLDAQGAPRVPDTSETALGNKLLTKAIETISYPVATTVRYSARISFDELNGQDISEISLEDAAGTTLAIKTFEEVPKTSENEFVFDWDDAY